jgi:hypothetical protein
MVFGIVLLIVAANLYATFHIIRSPGERAQKFWQLAFVWLLPFIGATLAISLVKETPRSYLFNPRRSSPWTDPGGIDDVGNYIGSSDSSSD